MRSVRHEAESCSKIRSPAPLQSAQIEVAALIGRVRPAERLPGLEEPHLVPLRPLCLRHVKEFLCPSGSAEGVKLGGIYRSGFAIGCWVEAAFAQVVIHIV